MESKGEITLRMERLRLRAIRKNKKAGRMLEKVEKELAKRKADLPRVLAWQRKAARLVEQGLRHIKKREEERAKLKKVKVTNPSKPENQVNFVLDKVSKRYIAKYGASSCVYRAHLDEENNSENVKIKDILSELSKLFDGIIDNVEEQCELDHPVEDKMRVMVTSNALKSPNSTHSGDMSAQSPFGDQ